MNYYFVTYLTEDEVKKTAYVKASSSTLIPFSLHEQDKRLKNVLSSKELSMDEYEQAVSPKSLVSPVDESPDESPDEPTLPLSAGTLYLKDGKVGGKYVVVGCKLVVEVQSVGLGGVKVSYPPTSKEGVIARHTEAIPYKESEHKHLIKKVVQKKEEVE